MHKYVKVLPHFTRGGKMNDGLQLIQEFEKNDVVFRNNYQSLQSKHPNEYVAIKNGEVIDYDKDAKTLVKRLENKNENLTTILIQFIPEKGLQILY